MGILALVFYLIPAFLFLVANIVMVFAFIERDSHKQAAQNLQAILLFIASLVWAIMVTGTLILLGVSLLSLVR